jgi:hypothetical protein
MRILLFIPEAGGITKLELRALITGSVHVELLRWKDQRH